MSKSLVFRTDVKGAVRYGGILKLLLSIVYIFFLSSGSFLVADLPSQLFCFLWTGASAAKQFLRLLENFILIKLVIIKVFIASQW